MPQLDRLIVLDQIICVCICFILVYFLISTSILPLWFIAISSRSLKMKNLNNFIYKIILEFFQLKKKIFIKLKNFFFKFNIYLNTIHYFIMLKLKKQYILNLILQTLNFKKLFSQKKVLYIINNFNYNLNYTLELRNKFNLFFFN